MNGAKFTLFQLAGFFFPGVVTLVVAFAVLHNAQFEWGLIANAPAVPVATATLAVAYVIGCMLSDTAVPFVFPRAIGNVYGLNGRARRDGHEFHAEDAAEILAFRQLGTEVDISGMAARARMYAATALGLVANVLVVGGSWWRLELHGVDAAIWIAALCLGSGYCTVLSKRRYSAYYRLLHTAASSSSQYPPPGDHHSESIPANWASLGPSAWTRARCYPSAYRQSARGR
ncbi:MAG: hypothetical protein B7733_20525 [Myxococcales bacterium FL481]|nr:MAG: hypothetical protein B7733_20525 [Myxococcales bacterium FL481]